MSIEATKAVWLHSKAQGTDKLVLLAIADFCNSGGEAWPGINRLAEMAGIKRRQLRRSLCKLESFGELKIVRNKGRGHTNLYIISLAIKEVTEDPIYDEKQVIQDPYLEIEKGSSKTEKGSSKARKGVTEDPRSIKNHQEPIVELINYFAEIADVPCPNGKIDTEKWIKPIIKIYESAGNDFDETKRRMAAAIDRLNEIGYSYSTPSSILKTALRNDVRKISKGVIDV